MVGFGCMVLRRAAIRCCREGGFARASVDLIAARITVACSAISAQHAIARLSAVDDWRRVIAPDLDADQVAESEAVVLSSIAQLEQLVLEDGGWSWCSGVESDPWLTGCCPTPPC